MNTKNRTRWGPWVWVSLVLLTGISCSLFSRGIEHPGREGEQVLSMGMPTAEGTVDIDLGLEELNAYRAQLTITFTADHSATGQPDVLVDQFIEQDRAAGTYHTRTHLVTDPEVPPIVEDRYEIGTLRYSMTYPDLYSIIPSGCMVEEFVQVEGVVNSGFAIYIREIKKGELLAQNERVNGVMTDRYQIIGADFPSAQNEQVSGEMWVAREGGYLVKATGQVEADVPDIPTSKPLHGQGQWSFGVESLNGAVITPPAECMSQGNSPLPITADAASFTSSQGYFSYSTQLSVEEVASFYQEALPPQGWTITERGNADGTLMWEVSRQEEMYFLSIMPSNGMTIVTASQIK